MTHKYQLTGMTCGSCEAKVETSLMMVENVTGVEVSKLDNAATITMNSHISLGDFQKALGGPDSKYQISALPAETVRQETHSPAKSGEDKSWFITYKPIVLIFLYITGITAFIQVNNGHFDWMQAMRHFMAGFFLVFSFFKMLNLKGFAESYVMYDILARNIPAWAYLYAFVELALGIANVINFNPVITNAVAFIVMTISIIGVLQSVMNKKKIQCACLGAVFSLPMSTVTIIEDALMIAMSGAMLVSLL